jgi:hypothetical protein
MYFVIIYERSDCYALTTIAYNQTLEGLAKWFIGKVEVLFELDSREEIEEDGFYCEFDAYDNLVEAIKNNSVTISDIENFSFSLSDITIDSQGFFTNYDELKKEFKKYTEDKPILWNYELPEIGDSNELNKVNDELVKICM